MRIAQEPRRKVIASCFEDRAKNPGTLIDHIARVLERAMYSPDQNQKQKQFTTYDLCLELIKMVNDKGVPYYLPWTGKGFERNDNDIALGQIFTTLALGEYQELGPVNPESTFEPLELLYENGITEVSKVETFPHMHSFGQSHLSVSQFYRSKHIIY